MDGVDAPAAARDFLRFWALHDRGRLGAEPKHAVAGMDSATRQVIYTGSEDLLDSLVTRSPVTGQDGELVVYLDPHPGQEYRWQLSAMLADVVVLNRPQWDPTYAYFTLRDICRQSDPNPPDGNLPSSAVAAAPAETEPLPRGEVDAILDEVDWEAEAEAMAEFDEALAEWRDAALPEALANNLRFLAHLSAIGTGSRVILASPNLNGARLTWESLKGIYFSDGAWHYHEGWVVGGPPPGVRDFEHVIAEIHPRANETFTEVMGSYVLGATSRIGHLPLVPSTPTCQRVAVEFYSRFRRLIIEGEPVVFTGHPQAVPVEPRSETDWRPALCDRVLLSAFPGISTADFSTFEYLHELPRLADFRHRLRIDAKRVDLRSAEEVAERLLEVSRELREAAQGASAALKSKIKTGRQNLVLSGLLTAVITGAGFISFGPPGAIAGGLVAGSLTAALERRELDRSTAFTGTELALMTLAEGHRPSGL